MLSFRMHKPLMTCQEVPACKDPTTITLVRLFLCICISCKPLRPGYVWQKPTSADMSLLVFKPSE